MPVLSRSVSFVLSSLCAAVAAPGTAWSPLPDAPLGPGRHEDLFFIDSARGWVVNLSGEVHHTGDGGATWSRLFKSDSIRFRSVGFADSARGWAGTLFSKSPLYETFDGGRNWSAVPGLPSSVHGICGLSVADDSTVYAVGAYYKTSPLLKTGDRGRTWTPVDLRSHASALIDVGFFSRDSGFVTGGISEIDDGPIDSLRAVVLFTGDGGGTWETRYRSDSIGSWSWKLSFPRRDLGFASIERQGRAEAMVLKTVDGGETWSEKRFPGRSDLQGIGFLDGARGWAGSHDTSYFTEDGGDSWRPFAFHAGRDAVNRIRMLGPGLGYAVGATVFKYSPTSGVRPAPAPRRQGGRGATDPARITYRGKTEIRYRLRRPAWVTLDVFDGRGRRVRAGERVRRGIGEHVARIDARGLAAGSYLYRLRIDDESVSGELRLPP